MKRIGININTNKIHKVSDSNLIPIFNERRRLAKELLNKYLDKSTDFILIFSNEQGMNCMYSSYEKTELLYTLEQSKLSLF